MPDYQYLIIGGGMTSDAAVKGIRQVDPHGRIGILSADRYPPYKRPPLSKALWKGEPEESIWLHNAAGQSEIFQNCRAVRIDTHSKSVSDSNGRTITYDKLLLATGGVVRRLPWQAEGIIYYRTFEDYTRLRQSALPGTTAIVIGGGFIGSEIAAALAMNKVAVTVILPETGIGARMYPAGLSSFLTSFYAGKGVTLLTGEHVSEITGRAGAYTVRTTGGKSLPAATIVAGIGIEPNVELARSAGLTIDNGIVVDELLRSSNGDILAAGDVANFHNPALGKRLRVEHEDNALTMGEAAGRNMAGAATPYRHLPFFYSDLFELGYEAVGELDARLQTVEDWKEEFREGVVYYLNGGRVRGVLLWNTWGQVDAARALIAEQTPVKPEDLKGRLPAG